MGCLHDANDPFSRAREDAEPRAESAVRRRETLWFLAAVLLHGLVYLFAVAPWMGEDEPWHFEYASQVADGHAPWGRGKVDFSNTALQTGPDAPYDERWDHPSSQLQVRRRFASASDDAIAARQTQILESMERHGFYARVDWTGGVGGRADFDEVQPIFTATTQPPGYYLLLGGWLALWPGESVEGQLVWARVLSLLLYVLTCWAGLEFARAAFSDRWLVFAAALLIAWLPMHARQAAIVNNDVLARTLSALVWMVCARRLAGRTARWEFALAVALTLLGWFVKTTTASNFLVLFATLLLDSRRVRNVRGLLLFALFGTAALAGVVVFWHFQHSPVLPRNVASFLLRVGRGLSANALRELATSWIGAFNWYSRPMSETAYVAIGAAMLAALSGGLAVLVRGAKGVERATLALCALGVLAQLVLVVLRGVGHGRYLMPALLALAALLAAGACALFDARSRPRAAAVLCGALVLYDAWFLWAGLAPNEYGAWGT
jgi:hypothetical protein